ncbi:MAG: tyrosine-type recombinase/integrase [Lachnospiraceae bacterium]|nr:tyrosine-type recombinase/integrase [Lachnospiraceae bacterium]
MSTSQPIRNRDELASLKNYYLTTCPNPRNHLLIVTGINTALRISDILSLRWQDIYDFSAGRPREHLLLTEQKTGKQTCIAVNKSLRQAFVSYLEAISLPQPEDFVFYGKTPGTPLSRSQAFRIIKRAGSQLQLSRQISCHSLRKTFGYHAWAAGTSPALLMVIFNHSSFSITRRYLGIEQDDKDKVFLNLNL